MQAEHARPIEERPLAGERSEEHTSELQSQSNLVCRLLLEKNDAAEANRYGLVNEIVESEQLLERAAQLAKELMQNSPSSLRVTKKLINGFIAPQLEQQIASAIQENAAIRSTQDFREGISSFLEKRKPQWSGK